MQNSFFQPFCKIFDISIKFFYNVMVDYKLDIVYLKKSQEFSEFIERNAHNMQILDILLLYTAFLIVFTIIICRAKKFISKKKNIDFLFFSFFLKI